MKKTLLCLGILLFIFLASRFYKISEIPASLYWDEASIAYNAYSILKTGRDEWGVSFPVHFRAFSEFKLPVYIYSTALSEAIFGLNEWAVRFPAVLFSLGSVLLTFLLGRKIFGSPQIGFFAALFLITAPWFFIFSRTGYEVSAGLMFFLLGIFLFSQYKLSNIFIVLSTISFVLSMYSYNAYRILVPLILIFLIAGIYNEFKKFSKSFVLSLTVSIAIFAISILPIYKLMHYDSGASRLVSVGMQDKGLPGFVWEFSKNYISHFSPSFLLLQGDTNPRSQVQGFGEINPVFFLGLILGVFFLFNNFQKGFLILVFGILISSIPAAITKESPHALRSLTMIPFIAILAGFGIDKICRYFKRGYVVYFLIFVNLAFFTYFYYNFLNYYPQSSSTDWQYGYKNLVVKYKDQFAKYDKVYISDSEAQPYIFFLYYLNYDPNKFRAESTLNPVDKWTFSKVASFNNFVFIGDSTRFSGNNFLVFSSQENSGENLVDIGSVKNLDDSRAFYVYEKK